MATVVMDAALEALLKSLLPSPDRDALRTSVLPALLSCVADIASCLQSTSQVSLVGQANAFGDDQLNVDMEAEARVRAALRGCPSVISASSEEDPVERAVEHDGQAPSSPERYSVAFDPLDGSSIIAPNWTVGTIAGVWDGASALRAAPREKLVAAVLGVYGPRTTALVALRVPGSGVEACCFEVAVDRSARAVVLVRPSIRLDPRDAVATRYVAPANLRAAGQDVRYAALITSYIARAYTLRYCGGLVPDVAHALCKGHGVYVSPATARSKAKLRRLYELCPVALVMECAGGKAADSTDGRDILDVEVLDPNEKGALICGTSEEVDEAVKALLT